MTWLTMLLVRFGPSAMSGSGRNQPRGEQGQTSIFGDESDHQSLGSAAGPLCSPPFRNGINTPSLLDVSHLSHDPLNGPD